MGEVPQQPDSSSKQGKQDKGKENEQSSTSNLSRKRTLDLIRKEQTSSFLTTREPDLSLTLTTRKPEVLPSSQTLETNEPQTTSIEREGKDTPASGLLRQINAPQRMAQIKIENDIRSRLTRITGRRDFLKENSEHPEVEKMRDALLRIKHGQWLDNIPARRDLSAAEAALAQEAKIESGIRRFEHIKNRLDANDHAIDDEAVRKSIGTLSDEILQIQKNQKIVITRWEEVKGKIDKCANELKQHAPELQLSKLKQHAPELQLSEPDKALIFPKGKTKDEQSDKPEKDAKKNEENNSTPDSSKKEEQLPTSGDHAESAAKTTTDQTLEISAKAKELRKEYINLLVKALGLHSELTSLNNRWDNFTGKRKDQAEYLKSSHDLQSQRFSEALNAMTVGADKGKSDLETALKYFVKIAALGVVTVGSGKSRLGLKF